MIVDARVLEEEFVPREVVHRHDEVAHLSRALAPLLDGDRPEPAFLFGPTGVGKTCIARYTLGQLCEQLPEIRVGYVNCWSDYTRFRVLYRVLESIGHGAAVHRQSTPTDELIDRLDRTDDVPCVVVLDEVDQLEDSAVLYDLHRIGHVSTVLIANREAELFAGLDDRVASRFQTGTRIRLERYHTDELAAILRDRARLGLAPDAVTDEQLRIIADAAAGDARVALAILRSAARTADRRGASAISTDVLEAAIPEARSSIRRKTVDQLHDHQRVLYDIVAEAGEIQPGELYERYGERVDEPKTRRTLRNYLQKMVHYDLIDADGEKRGRTYRVPEV